MLLAPRGHPGGQGAEPGAAGPRGCSPPGNCLRDVVGAECRRASVALAQQEGGGAPPACATFAPSLSSLVQSPRVARCLATRQTPASTAPRCVHDAGRDPCEPGQHAQPHGAWRGLREHFAAWQLWGRSILLATFASASNLLFQLLQDTAQMRQSLWSSRANFKQKRCL